MISKSVEKRDLLRQIRLLAMDIDGVLTDGSVTYSGAGTELKTFHVADGLGITLLRLTDVDVAWITGRRSDAVQRRAEELHVPHVIQGARDKGQALQSIAQALGLDSAQIAYIGDDWNDLPAYERSGLRIAVANAVHEVKEAADMVTMRRGGEGAVREVIEELLDVRGIRDEVRVRYLNSLRQPSHTGRSGQ